MTTAPRSLDLATDDLLPATMRSGLLTLRLVLPASRDEVWQRITEPPLLRTWSPVVPERALTSAGPVLVREQPDDEPQRCEVTDVMPGFRLAHTWGGDRLYWSLAPDADRTQLQLVHDLEGHRGDWPDMAAGWHVCLRVLEAQLQGHDVGRLVGQDALGAGWSRLRERYLDAVSVNDADD